MIDDEIKDALNVEASPEFLARVRTRIATELVAGRVARFVDVGRRRRDGRGGRRRHHRVETRAAGRAEARSGGTCCGGSKRTRPASDARFGGSERIRPAGEGGFARER